MIYYKSETDYLAAYHRGEIFLETTRDACGRPSVELPTWGPRLSLRAIKTTSRPDWRGGALPWRSEIWLTSEDGSVWRAVVGRKTCGRYHRAHDVERALRTSGKYLQNSVDYSQD